MDPNASSAVQNDITTEPLLLLHIVSMILPVPCRPRETRLKHRAEIRPRQTELLKAVNELDRNTSTSNAKTTLMNRANPVRLTCLLVRVACVVHAVIGHERCARNNARRVQNKPCTKQPVSAATLVGCSCVRKILTNRRRPQFEGHETLPPRRKGAWVCRSMALWQGCLSGA